MKKTLTVALLLVMILLVPGCRSGKYKDGTYTGQAEGHHGPVRVSVVVKGGKISSVNVTEHQETPALSDPAITGIPERIVKQQTWEVDAVAGATVTSNAIKDAVKLALEPALK
ncbi:MAG: FMN-binding protein [Bacillota bacterium]|jgi:urocanate reductase